jgi:phosphatidylserine/phosphatidylglycerophosphate/cardiolipin synthase-like enzyme
MIIDRETVIKGSFHFTRAAEEKNAENLFIIKSKELAGIYIGNWNRPTEHSKRYEARYSLDGVIEAPSCHFPKEVHRKYTLSSDRYFQVLLGTMRYWAKFAQ